jgi:hypothetical protein
VTCASCDAAEEDARTGLFHLGCNECRTRQVAHGLPYQAWGKRHLASIPERETIGEKYRAAVDSILRPGESVAQAHARVVAWDARIRA